VTARPIRVLVVDDSAQSRHAITQLVEGCEDLRVVGRACDGDEGLKKAAALKPDVITLDLEMPRLGGFAFLRLLMAAAPAPVIVVSSYAHKSDVFKALEFGAIDFVAKRSRGTRDELAVFQTELLERIRAVGQLRGDRRILSTATLEPTPFTVAVAASTGGPRAIQRLVEAIGAEPTMCLLVCQHMPERFTSAFAERLDRIGALTVREGCDGDRLREGHVFIAPGGRHLELVRRGDRLRLRTEVPDRTEHAPSADRLFESVAEALGARAFGVVLTGMGADGAEGARAIGSAGGEVWAEAEASAVIFGMPQATIATGAVKRVLPLEEIGPALVALARERRLS